MKLLSIILALSLMTNPLEYFRKENIWFAKVYDQENDKVLNFKLDMTSGVCTVFPRENPAYVYIEMRDVNTDKYVTIGFSVGNWKLISEANH